MNLTAKHEKEVRVENMLAYMRKYFNTHKRPANANQIAKGIGYRRNTVYQYLKELAEKGLVRPVPYINGGNLYLPHNNGERSCTNCYFNTIEDDGNEYQECDECKEKPWPMLSM